MSTGRLFNVRAFEGDPDNDGYVLRTVGGVPVWMPGGIESIVGGTGISVDTTDPYNPVVSATGGGGGGAFIGAKVARTAAQALTNNVNTAVSFTAADVYDTNGIHNPATNPSRLTIPSGMAGSWRISYSVEFASNSSGLRSTFLSVNGTPMVPDGNMRVSAVGGGESVRLTASIDLLLSAADYVEVFVRQTSGGTLDLSTAVASCQFNGTP